MPIPGNRVLPRSETNAPSGILSDELATEGRAKGWYDPAYVYVYHRNLGFAQSQHYVFEVEPEPPLEADPGNPNGLMRRCSRARILGCIQEPT
jgi:hypothetical protein